MSEIELPERIELGHEWFRVNPLNGGGFLATGRMDTLVDFLKNGEFAYKGIGVFHKTTREILYKWDDAKAAWIKQ